MLLRKGSLFFSPTRLTVLMMVGLVLSGCSDQTTVNQPQQIHETWDQKLLKAKDDAKLEVLVIKHFHPEAFPISTRPLPEQSKLKVDNCQHNIDDIFLSLNERGVKSIIIEGLPWKGGRDQQSHYSQQDLNKLGVKGSSYEYSAVKLFKVYGAEPFESKEIGQAVLTATFPKILFDNATNRIESFIEKEQFVKAEEEITKQSDLVYALVRNEMVLDVSNIYRSLYSLMRAIHTANRFKQSKIAIIMGEAHFDDYEYVANKIPGLNIVPVSCISER